MNKKLGLAVAGALVAFSSAANAGITSQLVTGQ
jgi:hypothetical protein